MVCAKVATDWFFFDGSWIKNKWHMMTRPEMMEMADLFMPRKLEQVRLLEYIRSRSENSRFKKP